MRLNKKQKAARARKAIPLSAIGAGTFRKLGYARVSSEEQSLEHQVSALKAYGCHHIFPEKISAANSKRPQFRLMRKFAEPGDDIVVYAYSRLHRDLAELLSAMKDFQERGIKVVSLTQGFDATTTAGWLQLSVTGAVDEHELRQVRDRTKAAMAHKREMGQTFGRPRVVSETVAARIKREYEYNSVADLARKYHVSKSTIYKCANA